MANYLRMNRRKKIPHVSATVYFSENKTYTVTVPDEENVARGATLVFLGLKDKDPMLTWEDFKENYIGRVYIDPDESR